MSRDRDERTSTRRNRRNPSITDLQDRIDELEIENEALSDKLDGIRDLAGEDDSDDD